MNFYFLSVNCVDLSIRQLHSIASFKKMSIGDLAVLRVDRRLILVIINALKTEDVKLTDFQWWHRSFVMMIIYQN